MCANNGGGNVTLNNVSVSGSVVKGYTKVGESLKRDLKDFGFVITKEGGHYKLTYNGDPRYLFTMAASGSDSKHVGGNLASEIKTDML